MLRSAQHAHKSGRLMKELPQAIAFVGEVQIGLPQSLRQNVLFCDVVANNENATAVACFVDRTIPVSPPYILASTVARHRHKLIHVPRGTFAIHHEFNLRTDYVPDLLPTIVAALTERARMAFRPHGLSVSVVIKLDQFRSPPDKHRVLTGQQKTDCGFQALWPHVRCALTVFLSNHRSRVSAPISPPSRRKS